MGDALYKTSRIFKEYNIRRQCHFGYIQVGKCTFLTFSRREYLGTCCKGARIDDKTGELAKF